MVTALAAAPKQTHEKKNVTAAGNTALSSMADKMSDLAATVTHLLRQMAKSMPKAKFDQFESDLRELCELSAVASGKLKDLRSEGSRERLIDDWGKAVFAALHERQVSSDRKCSAPFGFEFLLPDERITEHTRILNKDLITGEFFWAKIPSWCLSRRLSASEFQRIVGEISYLIKPVDDYVESPKFLAPVDQKGIIETTEFSGQ